MAKEILVNQSGLSRFLNHIKDIFSPVSHTHTKSEISDFPTDLGGTTITVSDTEPTDGADFWLKKY